MSQEQAAEGAERRFPHERTDTLGRARSTSPHSYDGVILGSLRRTSRLRYRSYRERYLLAVGSIASGRTVRFPRRVQAVQRHVALRRHPGPRSDTQGDDGQLHRFCHSADLAIRVGRLPEKRLLDRFRRQHTLAVRYQAGSQNPT